MCIRYETDGETKSLYYIVTKYEKSPAYDMIYYRIYLRLYNLSYA